LNKQPRKQADFKKGGGQQASPHAPGGLAGKTARADWKITAICAVLAILVFLVFGETARYEFVNYDDHSYVYENPEVTKGLTLDGVLGAFTHREVGLWCPLVTISHMIDCQLYGLNAGGHHLTNVLLHLASVILLFLMLRAMTGSLWRSAFVAALFAIHPLRVESVAWVAERKDVLSGLFFMLTLGAWLRYVRRPDSPGRYLAVIFLFAMGLMCKPMLVTLPFVLLLLDYWPLKRLFQPSPAPDGASIAVGVNWRAFAEKIPLLALSVGSCVVAMPGPQKAGTIDLEQIPFWTRMCEAPVWFVTYLGQMIWPAGLTVVYTHPEACLPWWPAALVLCGLLSLWIFLLRGKHPWLWMGWLWNMGMLVPAIGIVQISRHARADHYTYLPQIGLYAGLTWVAAEWAGESRRRRLALGGVAATVLCVLAVAARHQASFWRDSKTLWTHTLECTRDNFIARNGLGLALFREGRLEEAAAQYREALRIYPAYPDAHNNLGDTLFQQGRTEEATAQYLEALRIIPFNAVVHNNLGNALFQLGRTKEATAQYREALRINPAYANAHNNLGNALLQQGRTEEATAQYREALKINPAYANAHNNLGNALLQGGHAGEAAGELQKALDLQPDNVTAQNSLAWLLSTAPEASLRDGVRALELATMANQSTSGSNPLILRTLAAAYAGTKQFSRAAQTAQNALQLAEAQSNNTLAEALRREIKRYEAGHSLVDVR
jgi:Flp pilus assembly protein TadD